MNKILGTVRKLPANPFAAEGLWLPSMAAIVLLLILSTSSQGVEVSTGRTVQTESREPAEEAIHDELRSFRVDIEAVVEQGNWDGLKPNSPHPGTACVRVTSSDKGPLLELFSIGDWLRTEIRELRWWSWMRSVVIWGQTSDSVTLLATA